MAYTTSWRSHLPGRLTSMLALLQLTPRYFRLIYQPALFEQIRQVAEARRADVVIAYEMAAGDYVSRLDDGRYIKILDGCEPFAFRSPVETIRSQARVWKFKRFLRQMLDHFDAYLAVSDSELRWIRREVAPRRVPQADVADEEDGAEEEPDGRAVELLAAEGTLDPAGHRPGDLRPRPRLRDGSGEIVVSGTKTNPIATPLMNIGMIMLLCAIVRSINVNR